MEFNYKGYSDSMDLMFEQLERIGDERDPLIAQAMSSVCRVLRVSNVRIHFSESVKDEHENKYNDYVYYQDGIYDETRCAQIREISYMGTVSAFYAYQYAGDEDWTEYERGKIIHVLRMLYAFVGRSKVMRIANYMTYHDSETGVYNLPFYMRHLNELIMKHQIGDYCACFFNLRHFSVINFQIGRKRADQVIKDFLKGLADMFDDEDEIVARVGGDNFTILFKKQKVQAYVKYLLGTKIAVMGNEEPVYVAASAGYYMIPPENQTPSMIMDCISISVNRAKHAEPDRFVFFDDKMREVDNHVKLIQETFPRALAIGEFKTYYQPKIDINNNKLYGAEALCRWYHDGEIVPPIQFIEILERNRMICMLDFYMLRQVCADLKVWIEEGAQVVPVSVNFSRSHFGNEGIVEHIVEIIDRYEIPHNLIQIELTETTTDVDYGALKSLVNELSEAGISTAVDDFGTGYSSLNIIRELPWTTLKIDKSFLGKDDKVENYNNPLLKHIIAMANEIGLECIVEGVETKDHVEILRTNGCHLAQGFYYHRPMMRHQFEELIFTK